MENLDILFKFFSDSSWTVISENIKAEENRFSWRVPQSGEDSCMIKIIDSYDDSINDISGMFFQIFPLS